MRNYTIEQGLDGAFEHPVPHQRGLVPYLSAYTRQMSVRGEHPKLTNENWMAAARAHQTPIATKIIKLLQYIESRSGHLGDRISANWNDEYPLFDLKYTSEVPFLFDAVLKSGDVEKHGDRYTLTPTGIARLHPSIIGGEPGTCFVAMSFDNALDPAFDDGILAAVQTDCGYRVNRVDRTPHNESINDRILAGIRESQFLVADFTGQKQGVYFEAGFAQGLGRTVIRTCRDTDFAQLHFDTRQYFHLKWSTPADLRVALGEHIRATIGMWRR